MSSGVPNFQDFMVPLLRFAADGREHSMAEAAEHVARELGIGEDARREVLSSGRQTRFDNRLGWARTHLTKAGALEASRRAHFRITTRGHDLLASNPDGLTRNVLNQFDEYRQFRQRRAAVEPEGTDLGEDSTPEETLDRSYQAFRRDLAEDLLAHVKGSSPAFFEQLVVDLLVKMGYGGSYKDAARAVGRSGDEGIDGIIKEDRLGLDVLYVQAKKWENPVRRPEVQAFAGSLEGQRARKGVFITTSRYTPDAREYVSKIEKRIVLIDGEELAELMIDHGIGVSDPFETYALRRIDEDYFEAAVASSDASSVEPRS
jgi:restriction system protein